MRRHPLRQLALALGWLVFAFALPALAQTSPKPAVPVEPIAAILDAFKTDQIVALGEGAHGNDQGHAFRLSLIRDPRFVATVNDIVLEGDNARYQDLMDRYVRGEAVPESALRQVWQNSTQAQLVLERPNHEEFFRAVRAVNGSLPRERQLRILLSDPPIDWNDVRSAEDHRKWIEMRETYPADLIQREVLAKHRRALVVYGDGHLQRKQVLANYDMTSPQAQTIISLLEGTAATKVFAIHTEATVDLQTLQADVQSWPRPSLAILRGTILGAADVAAYNPSVTSRFAIRDGNLAPIPRDEWRTMRMEDQFDALLYLGPPSTITFGPPSTELCADRAYIEMRLARMALVGMPQVEVDRLKQLCTTVTPR
jgi:hypothetical protein